MPDTVYLTPAEWQLMAMGIDFTSLTNDEIEALIARASRVAESYAGLARNGSWLETEYVNEQHPWNRGGNTHRVYLFNQPIVSVDALRIRIGATSSAVIQGTELYTNNTGGYVEISSLALAFGVAPEIISLGLATPEIEVDYTAGYSTIPEDIKQAVAIIASAMWLNKKLFEEGSAGVVSFTIGSYQVSFGTKTIGGLAGFSNFVPDEAKLLLSSYKRTFLR